MKYVAVTTRVAWGMATPLGETAIVDVMDSR